MKRLWMVLTVLVVVPTVCFSQAPFKIEILAGEHAYAPGGNISLVCGEKMTVRVLSVDSLSGRSFCVSGIESSHVGGTSGAVKEGLFPVKDAVQLEGGCQFEIAFPEAGTYTFKVYEDFAEGRAFLRGFHRQRLLGVSCISR